MTREQLAAIRARDAKFSIPAMWVAIDGPCAGTDRSDLLRYVDELLRVVDRRASMCSWCGGRGERMTHPAGATGPCESCTDLREVLPG